MKKLNSLRDLFSGTPPKDEVQDIKTLLEETTQVDSKCQEVETIPAGAALPGDEVSTPPNPFMKELLSNPLAFKKRFTDGDFSREELRDAYAAVRIWESFSGAHFFSGR